MRRFISLHGDRFYRGRKRIYFFPRKKTNIFFRGRKLTFFAEGNGLKFFAEEIGLEAVSNDSETANEDILLTLLLH